MILISRCHKTSRLYKA